MKELGYDPKEYLHEEICRLAQWFGEKNLNFESPIEQRVEGILSDLGGRYAEESRKLGDAILSCCKEQLAEGKPLVECVMASDYFSAQSALKALSFSIREEEKGYIDEQKVLLGQEEVKSPIREKRKFQLETRGLAF